MARSKSRISPTTDADHMAALQPDRGREALSPVALPRHAWASIAMRLWRRIQDDRVTLVAGGVTYFMLLALVPALTAFVAIYGLFADREAVIEQVTLLAGIVPSGGLSILEEQLQRLASQRNATLSWTLTISAAITLWSAGTGVKSLFQGMNVAYHERETRGFVRVNLLALAFTIGAAIVAAAALGAVVILPAILNFLPIPIGVEWLIRLLSYGVLLAVMVFALAALYRWGPCRKQARWRWITPGAALAIVVIMGMSVAFSWYVSNFDNYSATYGSLGALIGFLTWMWLSVLLVILGGELNAEVEHQTAQDTTIGLEKPLGERGAYMADTVG